MTKIKPTNKMKSEKKDKVSQLKAEYDSLFKKQIISYLCVFSLIAITGVSLVEGFNNGWFLILDILASIVVLGFMYGVSNRRKDIQKDLEKETTIMKKEGELLED